jgi:uncharacterized protein (TIGR02001 family)
MKKAITLGAAIAAVLASGSALAGASVNAGATTNYLLRGVTQSSDTASVMGGADYSHDSGAYVGVWLGSLVGGTEMDVYGGFAGEAGGVGYDIGVITYQYTTTPNINFTEVYLTGTYSIISLGVYSTVDAGTANKDAAFDKGDLYVNASANFDMGPIATSVFGGHYKFDNDNKFGNGDLDYTHYGISFTSGEVTVAVEKNDIKGDEATRVVATWSKSWDI